MRRTFIIIAALALMVVCSAAYAQYSGSWTYTWDFNDGLQGWTLGTNAGATGAWYGPGSMPTLPDGGVSGSKNDSIHMGSVYLPDKSYADLDVSSLNLGNGSGRSGFILQADVYIPNLTPLTGFAFGYPGNMNHQAGIQALRADGKAIALEGNINGGGERVRDYTWDNTWHSGDWSIEEKNVADMSQWWDQWITLQIDYGYTTPGKFSAYAYIPWDNYFADAGWCTLGSNLDCATDVQWTTLRLGGAYSWTQAEFANAKLAVAPVPEPSSIVALMSGLIGMAGFALRRRK